ncbi:MAG: hypothetical protein SWZ49_16480 [Cyanobacteriota bacterium]|nr:hypothetical protein [Cyanobacteriota bacterium]
MSFQTYARKVRKTELSFKSRRSAFRSCINSYCWLTKQEIQFTYTRYSNRFGFNSDIPKDSKKISDRLNQAMDNLEEERNIFLEKLRLFGRKRIEEKMHGRRFPFKSDIEALYNNVEFAFETSANEIKPDIEINRVR